MTKDESNQTSKKSRINQVEAAKGKVISMEGFIKRDRIKRSQEKLKKNIKFAESQIDW